MLLMLLLLFLFSYACGGCFIHIDSFILGYRKDTRKWPTLNQPHRISKRRKKNRNGDQKDNSKDVLLAFFLNVTLDNEDLLCIQEDNRHDIKNKAFS